MVNALSTSNKQHSTKIDLTVKGTRGTVSRAGDIHIFFDMFLL